MNIYRIKEPFVFTIFGASGDLAKLKIFPALFALAEQKRFPSHYAIVGYARSAMAKDDFRKLFEESVRASRKEWNDYQEEILKELLEHVFYFAGKYDQIEDFKKYKVELPKFCGECPTMQIAYFSVPPTMFEPIVENLGKTKKDGEDIRLVLEKPFGEDEKSAQKLFHFVKDFFEEKDVYLLDHYLGKKAVRSLIPLRHMNRILSLVIKGREIANIQISALETVGVGKRIGYFDEVGAVKDMIQSHLLQILALITMSIPIERDAENVQEEKASALARLKFTPDPKNISLGQYEGYKMENEVTKNSETPTFAALKLEINQESWHGVPIFLRSGKKLDQKHTYLVIELRKFNFQPENHEPNRVVIELYPDEKLNLRLLDEDGATARLGEIGVSESIACQGDFCLPEHGLLLLDVIRGEKMHFLSFDEILASWEVVDKVLDFVKTEKILVETYQAGSCGPASQREMIEGEGFRWYGSN